MTTSNAINKFILVFPGRTGSSYLTLKVNNHPNAKMGPEFLDAYNKIQDPDERYEAKKRKLESFYGKERPKELRAVGFKTKLLPLLWNEERLEKLKGLLKSLEVNRIILLLRRNKIKHALSSIRTQYLFDWAKTHNLKDDTLSLHYDNLQKIPVYITLMREKLVMMRRREKLLVNFVSSLDWAQRLVTYYEEMLLDEEAFMKMIFGFLGVEYVKTDGIFRKATNNDLRVAIPNYDEVREHFKGTHHEKYFERDM